MSRRFSSTDECTRRIRGVPGTPQSFERMRVAIHTLANLHDLMFSRRMRLTKPSPARNFVAATPARSTAAASHARPRNEVVDLDYRSMLPSNPWGLVVGFRRRGLVRSKDRPSISLQQRSATETDKMPQLRFWARSLMWCQALDTDLVAPATGSTHPLSDSALGMSVEAVRCAGRGGPSGRADVRCKSMPARPRAT